MLYETRLDDKAERNVIGLRLGVDVCCGSPVDARGRSALASFVRDPLAYQLCMMHHAAMAARSFAPAGIPVTKELAELFRTYTAEWKQPIGLTLVPWQSRKSLCGCVT